MYKRQIIKASDALKLWHSWSVNKSGDKKFERHAASQTGRRTIQIRLESNCQIPGSGIRLNSLSGTPLVKIGNRRAGLHICDTLAITVMMIVYHSAESAQWLQNQLWVNIIDWLSFTFAWSGQLDSTSVCIDWRDYKALLEKEQDRQHPCNSNIKSKCTQPEQDKLSFHNASTPSQEDVDILISDTAITHSLD